MTRKRKDPTRAGGATEAGIGYAKHRSDIANRALRQARQDRLADFLLINRAALRRLPDILSRWLPGGQIEGHEYVVRNPTRDDQRPGSFKVNLATGRWGDFATDAKGGDPISLGAYLAGCGQVAAARRLAAMLGIGGRDGR
jgi:hypothetical protein